MCAETQTCVHAFRKRCSLFVSTCSDLGFSADLFDMRHKSAVCCYCPACCSWRMEDTHDQGGSPPETYATPVGWCEFRFVVPRVTASHEEFSRWPREHGLPRHPRGHCQRHCQDRRAGQGWRRGGVLSLLCGPARSARRSYNGKWSEHIYMSPSMRCSGLELYAKPLA